MITADVLIIGGGPAGAACAWYLMKKGVRPAVLDKQNFPRPKLCAGWITPSVLRDLDVSPADYPFGIKKFNQLNFYVRGVKLPVKTRQYAIRRYEFDHWMINRSQAPLYRHAVTKIHKEKGGYVVDDQFFARYIVGAGGTHCPVRRNCFRKLGRPRKRLVVAVEKEFKTPLQDGHCHLWFFENHLPGYAWYVPKADGYINIGIGAKVTALKKRGDSIQAHWECFLGKLENRGLISAHFPHVRGYPYYLNSSVKRLQDGNAFLTGDAAGLATADMGEGIGPAVKSGILAARAIISRSSYSPRPIRKYSIPSIIVAGFKKAP